MTQTILYLKWEYVYAGSGSYEAIDDILVQGAPSPIYYWKGGSNALHTFASWGTSTDGTGLAPTSFTANGQTFNLVNGAAASLTANWTLGGTNTILMLGDGVSNNVNLTIPVGFNLSLGTATMTCSNNSTLTLVNTTFPAATNIILNTGSTVNYAQASSVNLLSVAHTNLTISGGATKNVASNLIINGILNLQNNIRMSASSLQALTLNGTVTGSGSIETTNSRLFIGGTGALGTLNFATGATTLSINTFSVNRTSSGSLILGTNLTVGTGAFTHVNGSINLNGKSLTLNGAITLPASAANGLFIGSSTSTLTIGGSGAITNSLFMSQTSSATKTLRDLTLNRSGQTLTLGNALEILSSVTPTVGTLASGGNLTLKSTDALKGRIGAMGGSGSITGNVTVETFAKSGTTDWTVLGPSGITGLTVASWEGQIPMTCYSCPNDEGSAGGHFVSIQGWNEAGSGGTEYVEMDYSDALTRGKGYWTYLGTGFGATSDITWTVTGPVVQSNISIPLTNSAQSGYNLISNPYASPISWTALRNGNAAVADAIYIYNPDLGVTTSYAGGVSSHPAGANNVIPMGQGFYVLASSAATLTAQESNKVANNTSANPLLKATSVGQVFRLKLDGGGVYDETAFHFNGNATPNFDMDYDAYKLFSSPGYLGYPGAYTNRTTISSRLNNIDYSINALPYAQTQNAVIPVLVKVYATGQYTISPVDIQNFPAAACVILRDNYTNTNHNLRTGPYVCTIADTTTVPRFELTVCADLTTGVNNVSNSKVSNSIFINQDGNGAYVKTNFESNTKATISVYNTIGQALISDKEIEGKDLTTYLDLGNVHSQIVIVRVATAKESSTKRLYIP